MSHNLEEMRKEILENPTDLEKINEYVKLKRLEQLSAKLTPRISNIDKDYFGFINEEGKSVFIKFRRIGGTCVTTGYDIYVEEEFKCEAHFATTVYHNKKIMRLDDCDGNVYKYRDLVKQVIDDYYINKKVK